MTAPPRLPGFEYQKLLGSGGFADVFLYQQQLPRREVAVKVLLVDEIDSESRKRFVAEANVMAQLSTHPYIVTIYHADIAEDARPYFVMEYCPGLSLAERYKSRVLEVPDALRTGIRVGSAVAAAHAQGILHRDIKPANVLTNGFGWPALTDFGIASTLEGEVPMHTTSLSGSAGAGTATASVGLSVPWSPPEMFLDEPDPDVRSDVFSLAATIHTVLAGRTPYEVPGRNNGTLDIIGRIERGAITPIGRQDVPRSLTAVLAKAMSPRRTDRYDTVVDFVRALQRVELELGYAPTGIDLPSLGGQHLERPEADGGADETRMRPIATVEAQAPLAPRPAGPVPPPPAAPAPAPDAASTRMRSVTPIAPTSPGQASVGQASVGQASAAEPATILRPRTIAGQPGAASAAGAAAGTDASAGAPDRASVTSPPTTPADPARRRRTALIASIGAVAAALVIAAVLAVTLTPHGHAGAKAGGGTGGNGADGSTGGGDGGIPVQVVPDLKAGQVSVSADGTQATFAWVNPAPAKGDGYQWHLVATNPDNQQTDQTQAVATGLTPGQQSCIEVVAIRNGRTSANPLKECTP